jgi:putative ABC transport system ATP-binding protein
MSAAWVIETEELAKTYKMGPIEVRALREASMRIAPGEFIALMGASGSGKSTLLHLLGCLDRPTSGRYSLEGRDVSRLTGDERAIVRSRKIGFVFQNFNLLPRLSALENVMLPLLYRGREARVRERAVEALRRVGLGNRAQHAPAELSGGERQRVAIARALVVDPTLILADEPTGSLDSVTGQEVLRLLLELQQDGRTIILVTHDPGVAAYARRRLYMKDGAIVSSSDFSVFPIPVDKANTEETVLAAPNLPREREGGPADVAR